MYTYETALLAIEEPYKLIKQTLQEDIKNRCIVSKTQEEVSSLQAQYDLLEQIDFLIQNSKGD